MRTTTRTPVVDRARRSDALLAVGTVTTAVVAYALLVLLPYAVAGFAPPPGVDLLWRVGGPLAVVLAPLAALLAGAASWLSLWRCGDLDTTTRRLHLTVLLAAGGCVAFLASPLARSVVTWWQD